MRNPPRSNNYIIHSHLYQCRDVVGIAAHLLPLAKYLSNGQYDKVQPIASNFGT